MLEDAEPRGYPASTVGQMAERCRPDYEGMIKRLKDRLDKSINFRDAALDYFEGKKANGKMAELIGELVTLANQLQLEHDALIDAQEKDAHISGA